MSILSQPIFHDDKAAYAFLESIVWPNGPVCPHCGGVERIYELKGKSTRIGVRKCGQCRKPFTVKVGTVFESCAAPQVAPSDFPHVRLEEGHQRSSASPDARG